MWAELKADLKVSDNPGPVVVQLLTVRGVSTALFRLSHACGKRLPIVGSILKQINHFTTGVDIAWQVVAGPGLHLGHPSGVVIGPSAVLGDRVTIYSGVTIGGSGRRHDGRVRIGSDTVLGSGCKVLGSITVGDNCRVGANAVVLSDIPSGCTAVGAPARYVKHKA